jgi:DNA-binding GntR family transcriptional regulator
MSTFDILVKNHEAVMASDDTDTQSKLELLRTHSLPMLVQEELHRMIFNGDIAPGAKVNEASVARRFGVSRSPVREACRELVQAGVLEVKVQRGTFVRTITLKEAEELFEVRRTLADLLGRRATERMTPEILGQLDDTIAEMERAAAGGDTGRFFPLNLRLNTLLLDAADNAVLKEQYLGIFYLLRLFRLRGLTGAPSYGDLAVEHYTAANVNRRKFLAAIAEGKPEEASAYLREQIGHAEERSRRAYDEIIGPAEQGAA